jgi:hypothetical protein
MSTVRKEDTSHFYIAWVPLIFRVAEGCSFNWAKILSDSLFNWITEYREQKAAGGPSAFFMSTYIMDAICSMTPFPLMNWAWSPTQEKTVHEYHDKLWENKANEFIYEIFNWVMVPLHIAIFGRSPPRISDSIATNLKGIADWYVEAIFLISECLELHFPRLHYHYLFPTSWPVARLPDKQ